MMPPHGVNDFVTSHKHIFDGVEASLKNLQTSYIDLYQVHTPDDTTTLRETMRALNDLVRQGKKCRMGHSGCIRYEGLGILPWSPLTGGWLSGKFDRSAEKSEAGSRVWWTEKLGVTHLSWSTHAAEHIWKVIDELQVIAKELNVSVAAVALRWIMQRSGVTATIVGMRTMEQFNQNIQAINIYLSDEQMIRLTKVSDTPLPYPFDFIQMVKKRDNL